jgi:hypothetical protein
MVSQRPTPLDHLTLLTAGKNVALGGLVAWSPLDQKFMGSNPAVDDGFLRALKIRIPL